MFFGFPAGKHDNIGTSAEEGFMVEKHTCMRNQPKSGRKYSISFVLQRFIHNPSYDQIEFLVLSVTFLHRDICVVSSPSFVKLLLQTLVCVVNHP